MLTLLDWIPYVATAIAELPIIPGCPDFTLVKHVTEEVYISE